MKLTPISPIYRYVDSNNHTWTIERFTLEDSNKTFWVAHCVDTDTHIRAINKKAVLREIKNYLSITNKQL